MDRPKRLLSLDGGGIRGIIAAEVLVRIEEIILAHNNKCKCLGDYFDFIGGTSTGAILEATQPAYGIGWPPGEQNILLVSVGTGFRSEQIPYPKARGYKALNWAPYAIGTFMDSANLQQNILMQLMSQQRPDKKAAFAAEYITDHFKSLLTYHRYTISFSRERFKKLNLGDIDVDKVQALDCIDQIPALERIGQAIAREQVDRKDFEGFWDDDA